MFKRVLVISLSTALLAVPALADEPSAAAADKAPAVSAVTVTPKAGGTIDPQLKCADEACVKAVLKLLKTRYPRQYENLMRWCMSEDFQRMATTGSGAVGSVVGTGDPSFTPGDSAATGATAGQKLVCDDRFSKK